MSPRGPRPAEERVETARKRLEEHVERLGGDPKAVVDWKIALEDTRELLKSKHHRQRIVYDTGNRKLRSLPQVSEYLELGEGEDEAADAAPSASRAGKRKRETKATTSTSKTKTKTKAKTRVKDEPKTGKRLKAEASKTTKAKAKSRRAPDLDPIDAPDKKVQRKKAVRLETSEERIQRHRNNLIQFVEAKGGKPDLVADWEVHFIGVQDNSAHRKESTRQRVVYKTSKRGLRSLPEVARYLGLKSDDQNDSGPKAKTLKMQNKNSKKKALEEGSESASDSGSESSDDASSGPNASDAAAATASTTTKKNKAKTPLKLKLRKWQQEKIDGCGEGIKQAQVREYLEEGYTIFPSVLDENGLERMLDGPPPDGPDSQNRYMFMRRRKGNQQWMGARRTIDACIKNMGMPGETVLSPLVTREPGRYDMPLPKEACFTVEESLEKAGVKAFLKYLCRGAKLRTQDIMLSAPGSTDQRCHTDSCWGEQHGVNPRTHYVTVLIPLTVQDEKTGGTRVWPRSHRHMDALEYDKSYVDMIEPRLKRGDALVFDGLLSHLGMRNISNQNRYFYYAAFANRHDPNTDVTGN